MMDLMVLKWIWCMFIVGWAVKTDVECRKIRNYTVVVGIAGGLLLNVTDIKPAFIGFAAPLALIVLFAVHMMGAGDIKLLCAVGATLCYPDILSVILYSFVFCGLHILLRAAKRRGLGALFRGLWQDFLLLIGTRRFRTEYPESEKLPMAMAIAAGAALQIAGQIFQR